MILRALAGASLAIALASPAAAFVPSLDPPLAGLESAASPDGPAALLFNPAAAGLRYPSELALSLIDPRAGGHAYRVAVTVGGFTLAAAGAGDRPVTPGLGLAGGTDRLRLGHATSWIASDGKRVADHRLGALSRPTPWLSVGAVADHVNRPRLGGARLDREYALGLALRPLALSRPRAHAAGPRLTLSADLRLAETERLADAEVALGGEVELAPGIAARGLYLAREGGFQVGLSLLGVQVGYHAQSLHADGGERRYATHSLSLHAGEDRTVLAGPADRRVAVVEVAGDLGDEALSGVTLFGSVATTPSAPIHEQLERALEDPLTRGVLLDVRGVSGMAQIEELRPRVARLRAAGKPVVAYLERGGGRGDLYLAATCDRIVLTPQAFFPGLGLRVERRYYRKLLADWGVRVDRTSYGEYKSAYRNYSADSMPAPDRESIERNLDVVQELFVDAVATDRGMARERLMPLLDGRLWPSRDLQAAGLVDSIGYREDALRVLGRLAGLGDRPRAARLSRQVPARRAWTVPTRVAVVYASGAIGIGADGSDLLLGPFMGSETTIGRIERAFRNPEVEAVVLRVESPGGSTLASDLIHHATVRMKRETKKPLVVSMGRAAASGGYHIAAHADRILADRFTATGSIGVVLVKPSFEGWYARRGVRQEEFERGRYMRGWSQNRDWDDELQAAADSATTADYRDFVATVADGRGLPRDEVDRAARGRVWLGQDALERKLVDGIGGLAEAIAEARRLGGIPEGERIRIAEYRRPRPGLLMRLAGSLVAEAWERNARLPAPGEVLRWMEHEEAP